MDRTRQRQWPEAGPSKDRDRVLGADGVLCGPDGDGLVIEEMAVNVGMGVLGAKAVAAMTGAVTTSLLSRLLGRSIDHADC